MKTIIIFVIMFAGFFYLLNSGLVNQEKNECIAWKERSEIIPDWYWTGWQVSQCESLGILIKDVPEVAQKDN
jgi:quinol-cytochrome oxidoreductase complex cytochrome b subunit